MKRAHVLIVLLVVFSLFAAFRFAPDPERCPPEGRAKKGKPPLTEEKKAFNRKKNKSPEEPVGLPPVVYSINAILQGTKRVDDRDDFREGTYVEIRDAYLMDYSEQGAEDCNCHQGNSSKKNGDVHISLCNQSNLKTKNNNFTVVVEITPSYKKRHPGYGNELKKMKGKKVTVRGYLFYDEHEGNTVNYCKKCTDRGVWRKTSWEIHPVTYIGLTD